MKHTFQIFDHNINNRGENLREIYYRLVNLFLRQYFGFMDTAELLLRGHPNERATFKEKITWHCKSDHKCIDFYPCREGTPLERPLFWWKRGGCTGGVPLDYARTYDVAITNLNHWLINILCRKVFFPIFRFLRVRSIVILM